MSADNAVRRQRIVITFDSGQVDTGELERLTRLALRLNADLEGVFVEDSDLFRLSGLDFLEEFRPTSRRSERFQSGRFEQELKVVARRAERAVAEYARRRGVPWRFRVWRGSVEAELLNALKADVLALARLGTVSAAPAPDRVPSAVTAWFDGSEGAERALHTAAELAADTDHVALRVLLVQTADTASPGLRSRAEEIVKAHDVAAEYVPFTGETPAELARALHDNGYSALVLHRQSPLLQSVSLRQNLARLDCPVFLVQ